ncbi:MAG: choice-of-anchor D domain-containing protein [Bacteroidetes bacterium]|nr:choice-of-anchor D domain-containing protein [Bacteroidota bacterium]
MKNKYRYSIIVLILFLQSTFIAQEWTWIKGSNGGNDLGVYGTKGVSAPANKPGARVDAVTWTDGSGNFWLFGGYGQAAAGGPGLLNDLWKYNPVTNQWTWIHGSNTVNQLGVYGTMGIGTVSTIPGSRWGSSAFVDAAGNLWLFGGNGYGNVSSASGAMSDLWKYDPVANTWTWMKGNIGFNLVGVYGTQGVSAPSNMPGGRTVAVEWVDANGNFWLFGGAGTANFFSGQLNDLWKYDPSINEWTWVKGSQLADQYGTYGTKGLSAPSNNPGGRSYSASWKNSAGDLFVYSGYGSASGGPSQGVLNDVWKYNIILNEWVWINGSDQIDQYPSFGMLGVSNASNIPGGRTRCNLWKDKNDNIWMFGGFGFAANGPSFRLNDLWIYTVSSDKWTWVGGDTLINQNSNYGTLNVASPNNKPGARDRLMGWTNLNGDFFMMGGFGNVLSSYTYMNDLWKLRSTPNIDIKGNGISIADGDLTAAVIDHTDFGSICLNSIPITRTYTIQNLGADTLKINAAAITGPDAGMFNLSGITFTTTLLPLGAYTTFSVTFNPSSSGIKNATITIYNTDPNEAVYDFAIKANVITPNVSISGNPSVCNGSTLVLTASGASTYTWNTTAMTITISVSPTSNATYTVTGTDVNGCINSSIKTISVNPLPTISISGGTTTTCPGAISSLTVLGGLTYTWSTSNTFSVINVTPTVSTTYSVIGSDVNGCLNSATKTVSVHLLSAVTITTTSNPLCSGASATLTANGATTYTWSTSSNSSSIIVLPTSNTNYTVNGTDGNGCKNLSIKTITVSPLPLINVTGPLVICNGNYSTLTATGANTYTWSTNAITNSVSLNPTINTTYTVFGTDINGCLNSAVKTITVNSLPLINSSSSSSAICVGQSVTLTASGANTYSWTTGATNSLIAVSPLASTIYFVTGTNQNSCSNTASTSIIVNPLPTLTVTTSNPLICIGQTATLAAVGANTYSWSTSVTNSATVVSPTTTTYYYVSGVDLNGCSSTASVTQNVAICTELSKLTASNFEIKTYPNPFKDNIVIESTSPLQIVRISDVEGRLLLVRSFNSTLFRYTLDLSELMPGVYIFNCVSDNGLKNIKIIKE